MKTNKFSKKLVLKKESIVDLGNGKMNGIKGGNHITDGCPGCVTCRPCPVLISDPDC
ncbi:MAG: hypothetical protein GY940_36210 [bacterium]|nr:hypothetical protein [bacterium]